MKPNFYFLILLAFATLANIACDEDDDFYSPKPKGYCRIDLPKKTYKTFDSLCPYAFEIPVYAQVSADKHKLAEPCWYNIEFPKFKAIIHLSYKPVNNNLGTYIDDSHQFANKHQIKATGLDQTAIVRDSARVYGLLFDIAGNTASSVQFYITDSTRHFLRGALYFNAKPNIDSLKMVIDFIREDILHLIRTARWKN